MTIVPVSVVIPCYNCEETIGKTIASVFSQTLLPEEIICVNDASSDGTESKLKALQDHYGERVTLCSLSENGGVSNARNVGWEKARGEYVAFLDSDDVWHPQKLELQYGFMREHPECVLSGHFCPEFDSGSFQKIYLFSDLSMQPISFYKLLLSNFFLTPSVMLKRNIELRFNTHFSRAEDYLLWLQIAGQGNLLCRLNIPLAFLLKAPYGAAGLSANLEKMIKGEWLAYKTLHAQKNISGMILFLLSGLLFLKYLRRLWRVWLRQ